MSHHQKKLFPIGKLSEIPAAWIDKVYLESAESSFLRVKLFFKTRFILTMVFLVCAVADILSSAIAATMLKAASAFTLNPKQKEHYKKQSSKFYDLAAKNLLAILGLPVGILVSPKLVFLNFIPKLEPNQLSGDRVNFKNAKIRYPKNVKELQQIIVSANQQGKKVTVVGSGKSQGQQYIPAHANGVVISMKNFKKINIHPNKKTVTVDAGATWGEIQLQANKHKLAVKVMQASNIFSIGGSISTNIHGWNKAGTVAKTIRSITIMDATGKIKKLTPDNELFQYVVGGFNQFGIILSAEIELTDNEVLIEKNVDVKPSEYIEYFKQNVVHNNKIRMHLYRLSLDPSNMLKEGVAVNYTSLQENQAVVTPNFQLEPKKGTRTQRILLNIARHFPIIRKLYWRYEKNHLLKNESQQTTNEIMQPPICAMFNNAVSETEWLQEYFIPGKNLNNFLQELGGLLVQNKVNLLNATVRYVKKDDIAKMPYANGGDRFAVVLCFNQNLSKEEVFKAKQWISQAIDISLKQGGTYYLPYQPIASKEQFNQAYPTAKACYQKKLALDPKQTFSSGFSMQYMSAPSGAIKKSRQGTDKIQLKKSPTLLFVHKRTHTMVTRSSVKTAATFSQKKKSLAA